MKRPFGMDRTWLECINPLCRHRVDLLKERKFRCPRCGDLYDIMHNYTYLGMSWEQIKNLFDDRAAMVYRAGNRYSPLITSGIWRFRELVMPFINEKSIISRGEGLVPIIKAGQNLQDWIGDIDLWLILEGMTPTGSFKDYGGTVMITMAKLAGIDVVCCASTGDTSAMAAAYAAAAGMRSVVILPRGKVTPVQLAQPLVHGAQVITLPTDFDGCMKVQEEMVKRGAFPANSLNPNRIEGHQATVFQIAQFFDWSLPNWVAVPVGNGSNCSSVGKGMRILEAFGVYPISRILGCQSRAANPLAKSWNSLGNIDRSVVREWQKVYKPIEAGETTATAARIGDPVSRDKVMREIVYSRGAMQTAEEHRLNEAVAVCGKDGIFICPQTGTALAGIKEAVRKGWIKPGEKVVAVSTATGLKFTDSAAKNLQENIIDAGDAEADTVAKIIGL